MGYQSVSLKVCEGCGTLWIRGGVGTGVYCGPCTHILQQFPDPKTRLRPGRPTKQRVERHYGSASEVDGQLVVASTQGEAVVAGGAA